MPEDRELAQDCVARVARYRGDEFVVLCRGADAETTQRVGEAVEAAVVRPFSTPHGLVRLGVSVGVAVGHPGDQVGRLIATADRHMYGVKTSHGTARRRRATDPPTAG
ncbi:MAG: diguanylate cyclase [Nocardioides sp.]|nr:diguanylate cyclase [Nocardioides sp.]